MDPRLKAFAREMRHRPTFGEKELWAVLRDRRLGGHKFRRQVPIGPYIVDFVCLARMVAVELDGAGHAERASYDVERRRYLEGLGFLVLRFGTEVLVSDGADIPGIILEACEGRPG